MPATWWSSSADARRPGAARRARRVVLAGALAYLAVTAAFHALVGTGVVLARLQDRRPRPPHDIHLENLRRVDERVWASAQPDDLQFGELAAAGVTTVVDLRTGAADDRHPVDLGLLRAAHVRYVRLPVRDGHVPDPAAVRRFDAIVDGTDGIVLVHCGAGVGRSSTMAAAYLERRGRNHGSVLDTLALGSITLEQIWFLTTDRRDGAVQRVSEALDAPRRLWSRLTSL